MILALDAPSEMRVPSSRLPCRAGEKQIGDIRAGHEEHQRHEQSEKEKRVGKSRSQRRKASRKRLDHEGMGQHGVASAGRGERVGQSNHPGVIDGLKQRDRLRAMRRRDARHKSEPRDGVLAKPRCCAVGGTVAAGVVGVVQQPLQRHRQPEFRLSIRPHADKAGCTHTDDGDGQTVDRQRSTNNVR